MQRLLEKWCMSIWYPMSVRPWRKRLENKLMPDRDDSFGKAQVTATAVETSQTALIYFN
jgi:hypothetical protein